MQATTAPTLTADEIVFARRIAHHIENGASFEDAARAVIADDARIVTAFFQRSTSHHFPTPDERGISRLTRVGTGDVIAAEMSRTVHAALTLAEAA